MAASGAYKDASTTRAYHIGLPPSLPALRLDLTTTYPGQAGLSVSFTGPPSGRSRAWLRSAPLGCLEQHLPLRVQQPQSTTALPLVQHGPYPPVGACQGQGGPARASRQLQPDLPVFVQ